MLEILDNSDIYHFLTILIFDNAHCSRKDKTLKQLKKYLRTKDSQNLEIFMTTWNVGETKPNKHDKAYYMPLLRPTASGASARSVKHCETL